MTKSNNSQNAREFDEEVYEALRLAGWIFPETPTEVERMEQELAKNPAELPASLADASKVFDIIHMTSSSTQAGPTPIARLRRGAGIST